MTKRLFVLILTVLIAFSSCSKPQESVLPEQSGAQTEQESSEESEVPTADCTKRLEFIIAGNNAKGVEVAITLPENWKIDESNSQKMLSGEGFSLTWLYADTGLTSAVENLTHPFIEGLSEEYLTDYNLISTGECSSAGKFGAYYRFAADPTENTKAHINYHIFIGRKTAALVFEAESNDILAENKQKIEKILETLEIGEGYGEAPTDMPIEELFTFHQNFGSTKLAYSGSTEYAFELDGKIYFVNTGAGVISVCNLKNGNIEFIEDFSDIAPIIYAEKATDRKGFDYKIFFGDRVIYRSSKDPGAKEEVMLPKGMMFTLWYGLPCYDSYDLWGENLVYRKDDKVFLKQGEGEAKEIVNNSYFKDHNEFYKQTNTTLNLTYDGEEVCFGYPRFICGGEKIVIGVGTTERDYVGCGIYNIAAEEFEYWVDTVEPRVPQYPVLDRYINDGMGDSLVDAETYEETVQKIEGFNKMTFDYQTFVVCDYTGEIGAPKYGFTSELYNASTGERVKFFDANAETAVEPEKLTENYFLITVYSANGTELYAVKYR